MVYTFVVSTEFSGNMLENAFSGIFWRSQIQNHYREECLHAHHQQPRGKKFGGIAQRAHDLSIDYLKLVVDYLDLVIHCWDHCVVPFFPNLSVFNRSARSLTRNFFSILYWNAQDCFRDLF